MEDLFAELLGLKTLKITLSEVSEKKIILHCESILCKSLCPLCLQQCSYVKDRYTREIRDLSISGKDVYLHLTVRQFVCEDCNRHYHEQFDFVGKNSTMTHRYEKYIYYRCKGVDLQYIVMQEDIRWHTVNAIFQKYSKKDISKRDGFKQVTSLGIDEIALKKGHKDYVAVLVDLDTGCVLDILEDRTKAYLKAYFKKKGKIFCDQITHFCSDMWEGYLNCAKEVFPNATIVADRFHFFTYLQKELDRCRKHLRRSFPEVEELKNIKWLLLRPEEKLSDVQHKQLASVFEHPDCQLLKITWQARNQFRDILESQVSRQDGQTKIEQWISVHQDLSNKFLQKFIDFYEKWKDYILNYFVARYTTGLIEGINNKLKVIKRRAYGFLNFQNFRNRAIVEFE